MLSILALLLFVVPLCHAYDDKPSAPSESNKEVWSHVVDDVHWTLTEVTTAKGWQKPLEITDEHGFTTKAVQLLWDNCKPQMFAAGTLTVVTVCQLKKIAGILSVAALLAYAARLGLDRYR